MATEKGKVHGRGTLKHTHTPHWDVRIGKELRRSQNQFEHQCHFLWTPWLMSYVFSLSSGFSSELSSSLCLFSWRLFYCHGIKVRDGKTSHRGSLKIKTASIFTMEYHTVIWLLEAHVGTDTSELPVMSGAVHHQIHVFFLKVSKSHLVFWNV